MFFYTQPGITDDAGCPGKIRIDSDMVARKQILGKGDESQKMKGGDERMSPFESNGFPFTRGAGSNILCVFQRRKRDGKGKKEVLPQSEGG